MCELVCCYGVVVVLKGVGSLVVYFDGCLVVCLWGNFGMVVVGMGDVFIGVIVGLFV